MSRRTLGLGIFCFSSLSAYGLEKLPEHLDIKPSFVDGEWSWTIATDSDKKDPDLVFLPIRDSSEGELFQRPGGGQWDFLGMEEGEPVWILPQSDSGYTWPGFENDQSGLFGSYVETDPRAGDLAQPWVRIILESVEGPGDFSLFQIQGGAPVVWMASSDGIAAEDVFFLASPGHDHTNWAFSEKGVYRVSLKAAAFSGPGSTNPTPVSEAVRIFFSVGARADWRASFFAGEEVMDELLAGDEADADGDGINNLLEYAFGSDPRGSSKLNVDTGQPAGPELVMVESGDSNHAALRFFQRINEDADVVYEVEWSSDLSGNWSGSGVEHNVEDFGDGWERITIRNTESIDGARFGRVRVTVPE